MRLLLAGQRLDAATEQRLAAEKHTLAQNAAKLEALSPLGILSRGYAVATGTDGKLISSVGDLAVGEAFALTVKDGKVHATVTDKETS